MNIHPAAEQPSFDVIVVGGGHAGAEAALAAARSGVRTLLVTLRADKLASMPCNPSIGGIAKSHLVSELDALGGEMGRNADVAGIQFRVLNTRRGAAVRANRAQCDKYLYKARMLAVIRDTLNLTLLEDEAVALQLQGDIVRGIVCAKAGPIACARVILTAGTFLRGTIHIGHETISGGGNGQPASVPLADQLRASGLTVTRLKTGTPSRLFPESIHYERLQRQDGFQQPVYFSTAARRLQQQGTGAPDADAEDSYTGLAPLPAAGEQQDLHGLAWSSPEDFRLRENTSAEPLAEPVVTVNREESNPLFRYTSEGYRPVFDGGEQNPCWVTHTTEKTAEIVRAHLQDTALYGGDITGIGPRYCPSFEDKVVKFADRPEHHVFLEPESCAAGRNLMYPNGLSTSLPRAIQEEMVHSIPGLEDARFAAYAYAIEYDFYDPRDVTASLASMKLHGLYLAGQVNGTTGYEEAAAQGFMVGINAARSLRGEEPFILHRDEAYIGVMIDDLITKGTNEPYRMFTSRAENRLTLRQDAAPYRLLQQAEALGIVPEAVRSEIRAEQDLISREVERLRRERQNGTMLAVRICQGAAYRDLPGAVPGLSAHLVREIELAIRYEGYIAVERRSAEQMRRQEAMKIPADTDFMSIGALRFESREKLMRVRPENLGQAGRIPGVTPADLAILSVYLEKRKRTQAT